MNNITVTAHSMNTTGVILMSSRQDEKVTMTKNTSSSGYSILIK